MTLPVPDRPNHPDRVEVSGSLFRALLERHRDLTPISVSKGVLVVASHLIEELAAAEPSPSVLLSGFQHTRHWAPERDRYLQLSGETDVIAVFAGREPPPEWGTDHIGIRLRTGNPLEQEWFVLALGPTLAITLCGLDGAAHARRLEAEADPAVAESERRFDVVWSVDPEVARHAAEVVVAAIDRDAPDRAADVRARMARAQPAPSTADVATVADRTTAGMLARLEHLRGRERRAARRESDAKTGFLSRMSHELRTPLNAVLGFAQLLEGAELTDEDADSLRQIGRAGRHLLTLVDDLLDVSRIESGVLPVSPEIVAVADVVAEAVALTTPPSRTQGVQIDARSATGAGLWVSADRRYAVQVLLNLLTNAVKYDRSGAPVTVCAHGDDGHVYLDVRDHGPGIAASDLDEIFEPFFRLPATEGDTGGTGLGLSIARSMAAAMGGRIAVRTAVGQGSTFTLVLPAARHADLRSGARGSSAR